MYYILVRRADKTERFAVNPEQEYLCADTDDAASELLEDVQLALDAQSVGETAMVLHEESTTPIPGTLTHVVHGIKCSAGGRA